MTASVVAQRTERCAEKKAYRNHDAALLAVVHHDRLACPKCQRRKVLNVYACARHFHVGHCALGY